MNTDAMPQKHRPLFKFINIILIILNLIFAFTVCSTYSFETLTVYKKIVLIVPAIFLALLMIVKEFKVQALIKKMYINISILVGFILIIFCWYSIW